MSKKYINALKTGILFFMLSFVPLMILSFYNHPSADDYSYAKFTRPVWEATHSFGAVVVRAMETSAYFWNNHGGMYTSAFLQALQPHVFGEKYYSITAFITLGSLIFSNLFFAKIVLNKMIGLSKVESVFCAMLAAFLMIQWMPSGVQGIYWYNGSMSYTLYFSILLLMVSMSLYALAAEKKSARVVRGIAAAILAVFLTGGNLVTAFGGILYLTGVVIYQIISRKKVYFFSVCLPFLAVISGFILNIASPGTSARQLAFTNRPGVIKTIILASVRGCKYINEWFGVDTIIYICLLLPIFFKLIHLLFKKGFKFRYPILVIILSVGFICALFCPPYYAMGVEGQGRLINVIYFAYVAGLLFNVMYIMGWICRRFNVDVLKKVEFIEKRVKVCVPIIVCVMALCFGVLGSNAYKAVKSIASGEAKQYSRENYERVTFLEETEYEDVFVTPWSVYPELLYFDDITYDINNWKNRGMSYYYGLNTVQKWDWTGEAVWGE